jgi:2-(1,2-epoxy-1,2-dihydrophenyl)acetyl-CoA isomerase
MMASFVETSRDGMVAVVTLNHVEKRNAMSMEMRHELLGVLEDLQLDATCRAIVLTGAGGSFCAGGDLLTMRSDDPVGSRHRLELGHRIIRLLFAGPKPSVAAVEGHALGLGLALTLACDMVVAHPQTIFGASQSRVGLMPDMALLWTLPQRVNMGKAKQIMMLGEPFAASEAAVLGLVDVLAEDRPVLTVALEEAKRFATAPPLAVALTKAALARATDLESAFAMEADGQVMLLQSADHVEARAAFFAKRPMVFQGR